MHAPELIGSKAERSGLVTAGLVFLVAFPWVNSEWKGGWLQAVGGASLLAIPAGLVVWGIRRASTSTRARIVLRLLLIVAVLLSLAGIYSYGIFTTPWLLVPLWLAARRSGPRERYLWIALAAPCALIVGWLLSAHFEHRVSHVPTALTVLVVLAFLMTSRGSFPRGFR